MPQPKKPPRVEIAVLVHGERLSQPRRWYSDSREETIANLAELETIGERLGGGFVVAPIRERAIERDIETGEPLRDAAGDLIPVNDHEGNPTYVTTRWCFTHIPFVPAIDLIRQEEAAAPAQPVPAQPQPEPEVAAQPAAEAEPAPEPDATIEQGDAKADVFGQPELTEDELAAHFPGAAEVAGAGSQS